MQAHFFTANLHKIQLLTVGNPVYIQYVTKITKTAFYFQLNHNSKDRMINPNTISQQLSNEGMLNT